MRKTRKLYKIKRANSLQKTKGDAANITRGRPKKTRFYDEENSTSSKASGYSGGGKSVT